MIVACPVTPLTGGRTLMNSARTKKLAAQNAAMLAVAGLASFVLPMITDSLTDGRSNFLRMMAHMIPLLVVIPISSQFVAKAASREAE